MNKKTEIETTRIKCFGWLENGTGKHQSNCVYSVYGLAPTLCADIGEKANVPKFLVIYEEKNRKNKTGN